MRFAMICLLIACGGARRQPTASSASAAGSAAPADVAAACAALEPGPSTAQLGELPRGPAPLAGTTIEGTRFELAALRGRPVLVVFDGSWASVSQQEMPSLAQLAKALPELAIVRVSSESTLADARAGALAGVTNVFDHAPGPCTYVGELTRSWGVDAVPESFLVDRVGNVRMHFINWRDWSTPQARACVRAVDAAALPAIASAPLPTRESCAAGAAGEATGSGGALRGKIVLGRGVPSVRDGTTIFLVAKSADGHGPPLAIDKLVYRGHDVEFVLDESKVMLGGVALEGDVLIAARFDQDGDAMTKQPGDVVGQARAHVPDDHVRIVADTVLR